MPFDTVLAEQVYFYDIVWERARGEVHVLLSGRVRVLDRVSDAD